MRTMRSASALGRSLWVALFVAQAIGCVLVVPPIEHGTGRCEFTGSSACATCLRSSCQTAIDACCKDASCAGEEGHSGILDALDECGSGNQTTCASSLGETSNPKAATLRACVATTCKDDCVGTSAVAVDWSCDTQIAADNECSSCIATSCKTVIGTCCDDSSCSKDSSVVDYMSKCLSGDAPGCTYLINEASTSGIQGTVLKCVAECQEKCFGTYRPHQSCSLQKSGSYCTCSDAEKSSGNECTHASVGGDCVVGDKGCTCGTYGCTASSSGCSCDFRNGRNEGADQACSILQSGGYGRCCIKVESSGVSCSCSDLYKPGTCPGKSTGEYETPTCDYENVMGALRGAQREVTSCTF